MGEAKPLLAVLDLVVFDMDASVAFYRLLGLDIPESVIWRTKTGAHHVDLDMPTGFVLHLDSPALAKVYNSGWREPTGTGSRVVIGFSVSTREAVDQTYAKATAAGHPGVQPPYDTFWGARYAIVEDPDGNHVGLMSPPDPCGADIVPRKDRVCSRNVFVSMTIGGREVPRRQGPRPRKHCSQWPSAARVPGDWRRRTCQ
jgi:predicted lactoylglutathione lyase